MLGEGRSGDFAKADTQCPLNAKTWRTSNHHFPNSWDQPVFRTKTGNVLSESFSLTIHHTYVRRRNYFKHQPIQDFKCVAVLLAW